MIITLAEIKNMGAGEIKPQNKVVMDEVVLVNDEEIDDKEVVYHLHKKMEELRV